LTQKEKLSSKKVRNAFVLANELELERTHNGLWVDPDDQSTWLYHSWLLGETFSLQQHPTEERPILAATSDEEKMAVLQSEIQMLEELLKEEPKSKCTPNCQLLLMFRVS
jgi:hypothetical protein